MQAVTIRGTFEAVLETLPSLTNIGLVVLGAYRVESGDMTVGELSGFIFMFTLLVFPLRLIGYALSELPHSYAGYRRVRATVDEPLDLDPERLDRRRRRTSVCASTRVSIHVPRRGALRSVAIARRDRRGTVTAFVGPTGSGKSTLLDLTAGLLRAHDRHRRLAPTGRGPSCSRRRSCSAAPSATT